MGRATRMYQFYCSMAISTFYDMINTLLYMRKCDFTHKNKRKNLQKSDVLYITFFFNLFYFSYISMFSGIQRNTVLRFNMDNIVMYFSRNLKYIYLSIHFNFTISHNLINNI